MERQKQLRCSDVGIDCDYVICAKTEDELFRKAAEHGKEAHNISQITPELRERARSAMREVDRC
jgi:predicted small metal-binding protein